MSIENKKKQLYKIIEKMENPQTTIDEAASLLEQGLAISKDCLAQIASEQGKITVFGDEGWEEYDKQQ